MTINKLEGIKPFSDYLIATAKNANVFVKDWYQNVDVRIDYQTEIVERNGKDTLHFTLWINDTIIEFTAKEGTNTEIDSDGSILLAVEDIPEKYGNALSAGKFFLGCQNQNLTLKQLHVDGKTFCETPEIPEEPEGFEMPAFGAQGTVNEDALDNVVLLDHASSILTASNQDRVYLKFTVGGAGIGSIYMFQLTGSNPADAWGMSALSLMLNNNTLYIGNGWGKSIIGKAFDYEAGGTYMLSYKLTYVTNANTGKFIGMRVEVWTVVEKDGAPAWEKLSFNVENAYKDFDFGTDMTAPVIPYNILDNASRIKPGPLVVSSLANGEASITILQASVDTEIAPELPQAPEEPEGLPYPTFPTDNYVSETISLAGEGFDSLCDYLPDGEMLYFTVNLNYASGATPWFYLQLTGAAEQVWPQGVILEFNVNGNIFLHVDGNMSTTNYLCYASYAYAQNVDMKLAVKIEYVKDGELVTGMKIFVYQDTGSGYEKLTFANNNATDCVVDGEAVLPSHYLTENNIKPSKVVASFAGVGAADSSVLVKDIRLGETA